MTAKNYTGMLSGVTIPCSEEIMIFILLPLKYVGNLDKSFFPVYQSLFGTNNPKPMGFYNERNSVFGEYVPICIPLEGSHSEFGSISFKRTPMLDWLETYLDFDALAFDNCDFVERHEAELDEGFCITAANIFSHVSIAVEHKAFYDSFYSEDKLKEMHKRYKWDADSPLGTNYEHNSIMQSAYLCETIEHIVRKDSTIVLSGMTYETLVQERLNTLKEMVKDLARFDALIEMMNRMNLSFRLTGFNGQSDNYTVAMFQTAQLKAHQAVWGEFEND